MKNATLTALVLFLVASVTPAHAAVSVVSTTPILESNVQFEGTGLITISPLAVDQSPVGLSQVNPGRTIRSYLVQLSNPSTSTIDSFSAVIQVTGQILGIQTQLSTLRDGRFQLDLEPGFDGAPPAGGLEANDIVAINGNEISVTGSVGNRGVDPIRIFTAVPEAASFLVWSGIAGIGMVSCPRRRRA